MLKSSRTRSSQVVSACLHHDYFAGGGPRVSFFAPATTTCRLIDGLFEEQHGSDTRVKRNNAHGLACKTVHLELLYATPLKEQQTEHHSIHSLCSYFSTASRYSTLPSLTAAQRMISVFMIISTFTARSH